MFMRFTKISPNPPNATGVSPLEIMHALRPLNVVKSFEYRFKHSRIPCSTDREIHSPAKKVKSAIPYGKGRDSPPFELMVDILDALRL